LAVVLAAWSADGCTRPVPPRRPNVILIVADTLRADHLGCYGYRRPTSPAIDRFSRQATLYRNAHATAPWTVPSHASLFTGLYPFQHGAHTVAVDEPTRAQDNVQPLARTYATLAEVLAGSGYQTGAIVANDVYLAPRYGLDRGFQDYVVQRLPAGALDRHIIPWLEQHRAAPFFLFVNYMDTHSPYDNTPNQRLPDLKAASSLFLISLMSPTILGGGGGADPSVIDPLLALTQQYDLGVANLDDGIDGLFESLRRAGLYDDALIIVTSDHGEYFGEHDLIEHGKDVYEAALQIPLLVKAPHQTVGRVEDRLTSLVHVPGMVMEQIDGAARDVFPDHWPAEHIIAQSYYARLKDLAAPWGKRFDRRRDVLYAGQWKLILSSDGAPEELYDLASDPAEKRNRYGEDGIGARLARELRASLALPHVGGPEGPRPTLSAGEMERMHALGYL
jgi:arylsulfatase A-like enzyme